MYNLSLLKSVGEDVYIATDVKIKRPRLMSVKSRVAIDDYFYSTVNVEIGNYVHIGPMVSIIGGENGYFQMGDFCTIAAGSRLICVGDEHLGEGLVSPLIPDKYRDVLHGNRIIMEDFSSIATNVTIFPGVTIKQGAVIGAGAVVTHDCQEWTIYLGNPARPYKERRRDKMLEYAKELGWEGK